MEPYLRRQRARCHVVRPAERREEVIERHFVGDVDGGESQAPLVAVAAEQVVLAHGYVEQIAWGNSRRVVIVVLGSGQRNGYVLRAVACCGTEIRTERRTERSRRCRKHAPAEESCLELLIRSKSGHVDEIVGTTAVRTVRTGLASEARQGAGHKAAIIPPVEADKWRALPGLVLQVCGLVELFVVVDAKDRGPSGRGANAADLWSEETRRYTGHHHKRRKAVEVRYGSADRVARDFRAGPLDRISD